MIVELLRKGDTWIFDGELTIARLYGCASRKDVDAKLRLFGLCRGSAWKPTRDGYTAVIRKQRRSR